jgi:redox-sensitive bicupin YhaK (pirin superfamily)
VRLRVTPAERDLGEFTVRRVLPSPKCRSVGPFVFFDHMGPADFAPGKGIQVRPHPHIGLATVTYLFEGQIMHRDSLGYVQAIAPAAVNLMTAGRGIVHSERAGDDVDRHSHLHGIQSWMALPAEFEEVEPAFLHYPADSLPELRIGDVIVRVIIGGAYGEESPVSVMSPMLYLECRMPDGAELELPGDVDELACYVVSGKLRIDDEPVTAGTLAVLAGRTASRLVAIGSTRVMVLGGQPLGERHVWWNFVSSSRERIERAKQDWAESRFGRVPGDDEFIPLPDR